MMKHFLIVNFHKKYFKFIIIIITKKLVKYLLLRKIEFNNIGSIFLFFRFAKTTKSLFF